jgi:hypothetical protein
MKLIKHFILLFVPTLTAMKAYPKDYNKSLVKYQSFLLLLRLKCYSGDDYAMFKNNF